MKEKHTLSKFAMQEARKEAKAKLKHNKGDKKTNGKEQRLLT